MVWKQSGLLSLVLLSLHCCQVKLVLNNKQLVNNVLRCISGSSLSHCNSACFEDVLCLSLNFHAPTLECQLNFNTSTGRPNDLVTKKRSFFSNKEDLPSPTAGPCSRITCLDSELCHVQRGSNHAVCVPRDVNRRMSPDNVCTVYERDCYDIMMKGNKTDHADGVYQILIPGFQKPTRVYCDMTSKDPGWIVIQRRTDGSEDFDRNWYKYSFGFGNLSNEFWLGNWKLTGLTREGEYKLRIELEDFENETAYAAYDSFMVKREKEKFKLILGGYNGTAGDSFGKHNGMKFTTKDRDNDVDDDDNCAVVMHSGWWFRKCQQCNLNGEYRSTGKKGITWNDWRGQSYSLKKSLMKIRRLENDP